MKNFFILLTATLITVTASVTFANDKIVDSDIQQIQLNERIGNEEGAPIAHGTIVNCNVSVTLRKSPSVYAEELAQIPLGERVSRRPDRDTAEFYCVRYQNFIGYVLREYLQVE